MSLKQNAVEPRKRGRQRNSDRATMQSESPIEAFSNESITKKADGRKKKQVIGGIGESIDECVTIFAPPVSKTNKM